MPKCKGCNAEIEWIKTMDGNNTPIDKKPVRVYQQVIAGIWELKPGHMPHFATCKQSKLFGRKKKVKNK